MFTVREVRTEVRPIVFPGGVVVPTSVLLEINDGLFQNDLLVSLQSARVTGLFAEIASIKANHTSVANFATATTTLNAIRAADPVQ